MDIEGLKKLVNDWYSKQGVTDNVEVVITIGISGNKKNRCKTRVRTNVLVKDFITTKMFMGAEVYISPTTIGRLEGGLRSIDGKEFEKDDKRVKFELDKTTVSDFTKLSGVKKAMIFGSNAGELSIKCLNEALVFYGFKPIT